MVLCIFVMLLWSCGVWFYVYYWNQWFMPKVLLICCLVGKDGLVDIIMQIDGIHSFMSYVVYLEER